MKQTEAIDILKSLVKKRKNVNYILSIASILIAILSISIAQNYQSYIASVVILSCAGSLIILISFCSVQSFELDTYITVFFGYLISFSMICIVPLDAALITSDKNNQQISVNETDQFSDNFKKYWIAMYWVIFFLSNLVYSLQQFFHNNGYISFSKKIKAAFKEFIKLIAIGVVAFIILSIICLYWLKIKGLDNVLAVALVISNVYGISILAFLFGYGLVKVPFYLWNKSQREDNLIELLCKTHELFKQYQSSYWRYYDICIVSQKIQRRIINIPNFAQYLQLLKDETPDPMDSNGYRFKKNILYQSDEKISQIIIKLNSNGQINEDLLASIRYEINIRKFQYERQIQKWKRISSQVFSLIAEESMEEIDRRLSNYSNKPSTNNARETKQQKPLDYSGVQPVKVIAKKMSVLVNIGFKLLAIILGLISVLIIFCEATLVFGSPNKALAFYQMIKNVTNIPGIITLMLLVLFYIIFCTYFALGKLKVFGSFELFPYFTHRDILIQNASTCLFLTFPLCYNVMLLFGIIDKSTESDGKQYQSGFDRFYDPMKEIPFFGHYYNVIVCFLIVIVGIASSFKKTQNLIQKLSKNKIQMNTQVQDDLMLKGELYILQEWHRMKEKEEIKEIQDTTEQELPPEKQQDSLETITSRNQVQEVAEQEIQQQDIGQEVKQKDTNFFRKVSNFFKRSSVSSKSDQNKEDSQKQKSLNTQQIQLQSSSISQQENSSNFSITLTDEESQRKASRLEQKLTKKN